MPKAKINGIDFYYETHGEGLPLVLSHGFAGTTRMWDPQVPPLSKKFKFIIYDMRGHGQTEAPPSLSQYSLDIVIEDLYQLLRHLGVEKAVVGGLSLGGYLSLHFYHQHADMVKALLLIDTGPGYRSPEKAQEWNKTRLATAELLETKGMQGFADSELSAADYYTTRDIMLKLNPIGLANVSKGVMINPWGVDMLKDIKVPTLIIVGDRDTGFIVPSDYMAQRIPESEKVVIPNAGHGANLDQPELFNSTIIDFLNRRVV